MYSSYKKCGERDTKTTSVWTFDGWISDLYCPELDQSDVSEPEEEEEDGVDEEGEEGEEENDI